MKQNWLRILSLGILGLSTLMAAPLVHADDQFEVITRQGVKGDADLLCTNHNQNQAVENYCSNIFDTCRTEWEHFLFKQLIDLGCTKEIIKGEGETDYNFTCAVPQNINYHDMIKLVASDPNPSGYILSSKQCIDKSPKVEAIIVPYCGDGKVNPKNEDCDFGADGNDDIKCTKDCKHVYTLNGNINYAINPDVLAALAKGNYDFQDQDGNSANPGSVDGNKGTQADANQVGSSFINGDTGWSGCTLGGAGHGGLFGWLLLSVFGLAPLIRKK